MPTTGPRKRRKQLGDPEGWIKRYLHTQPPQFLGTMSELCSWCGSLNFIDEAVKKTIDGQTAEIQGSKCCSYGDVRLPIAKTPPEMVPLWIAQDHRSKRFREDIRKYNNSLAFTSFKYNEDERLNWSTSNWKTFSVQGAVYHYQGNLESAPGELPAFNQCYLHDPDYANEARLSYGMNSRLDRGIIAELDMLLREVNPFVLVYKHAKEMLSQVRELDNEPFRLVLNPQMKLISERYSGEHAGRHNVPTSDEIALIIPDELDDGRSKGPRDLILAKRVFNADGEEIPTHDHKEKIHVTHPAYLPLHYVLLFPYGDHGWHYALRLGSEHNKQRKRDRLSQRHWYRHYLSIRHSVEMTNGHPTVINPALFSPIFHSRRLFQQLLVDSYAATEEAKMNWLRTHQDNLRADVYCGVADALNKGDNSAEIGTRVILPSSHLGSKRFMQQAYQDAMAVVRKNGKPSFFITFTCNPKWPEIVDNLLPGQNADDRPDLIGRVFWLKCKAFIKDLKDGILGDYLSHCMTIEYQKRGLPHMHLLLNVKKNKFPYNTPDLIDQVISAELPDEKIDPEGRLRELVIGCMCHSVCGELNPKSPCMFQKDGSHGTRCAKEFPKPYRDYTTIPEKGGLYPNYRRRNNGKTFTVRNPLVEGETIECGNEWVVPHNPELLRKYEAHINVEVCSDIGAVKYCFKYIHKGVDRATIEIDKDQEVVDELAQHVAGRYIGAIEGYWRLQEYDTHQCYPPVTRLSLHIEDHQPVFYPNCNNEELLKRIAEARSTLMAWFDYNRAHLGCKGETEVVAGITQRVPADLSEVLYPDFPEFAVYQKKSKIWKLRSFKKGVPIAHQRRKAVGRMYHASIMSGERYYLRVLLTMVPGATSYADLRTFEGITHSTFRQACIARGVAENDQEWEEAFDEAKVWQSCDQLRNTFTMGLRMNLIADPLAIWEKFKADFGDDSLTRRLARENVPYPADLEFPEQDFALFLIEESLIGDTDHSLKSLGLPQPKFDWGSKVKASGQNFDPEEQQREFERFYPTLNPDQKSVFDEVTMAVDLGFEDAHFYLQGPGGSGKTHLYKTLCYHYRAKGKTVLCVASSGIAALLLPGGRTSHSQFGIPIDLTKEAVCSIKAQSKKAQFLRGVDLIIWDEVSMQHKNCFEAVHRLFCDIKNVNADHEMAPLFAGVPALLGGDFAQILPVVQGGSRGTVVDACLQRSWIWKRLTKVFLRRNMRLRNDPVDPRWQEKAGQFREWLSQISYKPEFQGSIDLPDFIQQPYSVDVLASKVYPSDLLKEAANPARYFESPFVDRCLLTTKNVISAELNSKVFDQFPGVFQTFRSFDLQEQEEAGGAFEEPIETLNSIDLAGLPPSVLKLKLGMPVMLLRNLLPDEGLCNGTRMIILGMRKHVLEVMILGGDFHGQKRLIPRISLFSREGELPYILRRKQFPIKPSFAMTINKSQGQSFKVVGLDLRNPCFSHGQFYVGHSRTSDVSELYVCLPDADENNHRWAINIVYPEVLKDINGPVVS